MDYLLVYLMNKWWKVSKMKRLAIVVIGTIPLVLDNFTVLCIYEYTTKVNSCEL